MKKLLSLLLALILCVLPLSACSGEECTSHSDADGDGKCDACSATVETGEATCDTHADADGDLVCDVCRVALENATEQTEAATDAEYTLTVTLDDGSTLAGVSFTLTKGSKEIALTSGTDGTVKAILAEGTYFVGYDYDTLPEGCIPDVTEITVEKGTTAIALSVIDNNPNGTPQKPFFISEDVTAVSLDAGEELYYNYRGSALRQLKIEHAGVTVTVGETVYTAENGTVTVTLEPTIGEVTRFSVKNTTSAALETEIQLVAPLGTMENPIVLSESETVLTLSAGEVLYYLWTADKSGVLLVTSACEYNNISMTNNNTYAVSAMTAGSAGEYVTVTAGDEILISVSSTNKDAEATVDMKLSCFAATATDPVPAVKSTLDLSFAAGASLSFSAQTGKTLSITDDGVSVTVGDTVLTPDANGVLTLTLAGEGETTVFTVTNTKDSANGITINVE